MTTQTLIIDGKHTYVDANGVPLVGGKVYFYVPNTTTPKDTYQDSAGLILNTNPVTLDGGGRCILYGTGDYRQVVKDALGNTIWDVTTSAIPQIQTLLDSIGTTSGKFLYRGASGWIEAGLAGSNGVKITDDGVGTLTFDETVDPTLTLKYSRYHYAANGNDDTALANALTDLYKSSATACCLDGEGYNITITTPKLIGTLASITSCTSYKVIRNLHISLATDGGGVNQFAPSYAGTVTNCTATAQPWYVCGQITSGSADITGINSTYFDTSGIAVGSPITSAFFPAGTTVLSKTATKVTASANATATSTNALERVIIGGIITTTSSTSGVTVGATVEWPGVLPHGARVTAKTSSTITVDQGPVASATGTLTIYNGMSMTYSPAVAGADGKTPSYEFTVASTSGLTPGMRLFGPGIGPNTYIDKLGDANGANTGTKFLASNPAINAGSGVYTSYRDAPAVFDFRELSALTNTNFFQCSFIGNGLGNFIRGAESSRLVRIALNYIENPMYHGCNFWGTNGGGINIDLNTMVNNAASQEPCTRTASWIQLGGGDSKIRGNQAQYARHGCEYSGNSIIFQQNHMFQGTGSNTPNHTPVVILTQAAYGEINDNYIDNSYIEVTDSESAYKTSGTTNLGGLCFNGNRCIWKPNSPDEAFIVVKSYCSSGASAKIVDVEALGCTFNNNNGNFNHPVTRIDNTRAIYDYTQASSGITMTGNTYTNVYEEQCPVTVAYADQSSVNTRSPDVSLILPFNLYPQSMWGLSVQDASANIMYNYAVNSTARTVTIRSYNNAGLTSATINNWFFRLSANPLKSPRSNATGVKIVY